MTQQGPGDGSGNEPGNESVSDEVQQLAIQLRASIQSFTQGELRRQERLTQFDQHLMQMEASIRDEVTRLRSTGSVVELVAGEVRRAVDGLARLGFDPTHEQLRELQQQVAAIPQPDLEPIGDALGALRDQLTAMDADLRALRTLTADRFDALPGADHLAASLEPALRSIHETADPAPVLLAVEQVANRLADQLTTLSVETASMRSQLAAIPDHAERLETLDASTAEIRRGVALLADAATVITRQTTPIASVASELTAVAAAIAALEGRVEAGTAISREAADSQRLALARVVASADGLSASLGAVRASIGTAAETAGTTTTAAINAAINVALDDRLQAVEARIREALDRQTAVQQAMAAQVASTVEAANRREAAMDERLDSLASQLRALTEQLEAAPGRTSEAATKAAPTEASHGKETVSDSPAPRAPEASKEVEPTESPDS